jgi:hypothetical protein
VNGLAPKVSVRSTTEPLDCDDWLREFLEFAWSTNGERPWSERRIREFLRSEDPALEVYGGMRIYQDLYLVEIPQDHYEVLASYLHRT